MKYFTLEECIYSDTAVAKGIKNIPTEEHKRNIIESIETLIDPLRAEWENYCKQNNFGSSGLTVSSGYRGKELNKIVKGSTTSAHCYGYAFDLIPTNKRLKEFKDFCRKYLANKNFDQMISEDENSQRIPKWIHIGYKHPSGKQRKQFLSMINNKYYPMTT